MKVLLTGSSSFTGYWFAEKLASAGHTVTTSIRGRLDQYDGLRRERLKRLEGLVDIVENCAFGDEVFVGLVRAGKAEVLAHHGANVTNYKSMDFDVSVAVKDNTLNLAQVLREGKAAGIKAVVLTGSVFEQNEGAGSAPLVAFSPYGLSKGLTSEVFAFWCDKFNVPLAKFVIPNPFGPFKEPRFTHYLFQCWTKGETASVKTPAYVRDNIHVCLLASAYADFLARATNVVDFTKLKPTGYVESQGAFATRFAHEIGSRLRIKTPLEACHSDRICRTGS